MQQLEKSEKTVGKHILACIVCNDSLIMPKQLWSAVLFASAASHLHIFSIFLGMIRFSSPSASPPCILSFGIKFNSSSVRRLIHPGRGANHPKNNITRFWDFKTLLLIFQRFYRFYNFFDDILMFKIFLTVSMIFKDF